MEQKSEHKPLTPNIILDLLKQKVSLYNARLLLTTAMVESGMRNCEADASLNDEDARNLCLKLISKGGPSFHVGQAVYRQYIQ